LYSKKWKHRILIKVDHTKIKGKERLKNFPAKVNIIDSNLAKKAHPKGWDFLFTSSDGLSKLEHEIQHWDNKTGHLIAWVKIPLLSPFEDTIIYLYYGNPSSTNQENGNVWSSYQLRRSFKDNDTPDKNKYEGFKRIDFLKVQVKILESLFKKEWFADDRREIDHHPAYEKWKICNYLLHRNGKLKLPQDEKILPLFCKIILDNFSIIQCTKGNIDTFTIGKLANYGDIEVQKRIKSTIKTLDGYKSVNTELQHAAWHLSHNHSIEAFEKKGPDQKINIPSYKLPILAECKTINKETGISRIKNIISKANKQIKNENSKAYGLIVIDLSEKIINNNKLDDNVPIELKDIINETRKILNNKYYKSVSAALLFWPRINILKPKNNSLGKGLYIASRTQSILIKHKNPIYVLNEDLDSLNFGNMVEMNILFDMNNNSI
jgi:hypothetical protein